ncbi:MAG: YcxB family protein [Saprospiraceae bacterium]|uniref:YcxB family protein n=1 Tax=Candidatus Opimibacter skivensis TaxID=2982028 RepID=A0A9D7SWY7_9BACT|nr:YcxB family protein [Candidatus Opimibacter skivensis]
MTYTYIPDENDYLNYLYYATTKSQRVRKKRTMNKLVILFLYFIAGLFLYNSQGPINSGLFFMLCLPMYFFYTYFEKRQYKRHFTKYIKANYSSEIGVNTIIEVNEEGVSIAVGDAKTTMPWTEIESINETGTLILIEEKNQNAIVIPKQKTNGIADLIAELKGIAASHTIPFNEDLDWKWK